MSKHLTLIAIVVLASPLTPVFSQSTDSDSDTDTATRVGTCEDAKSQMAYFCEEKESNSNDMMLGFNACANSKKNVKEACEGIVEPDLEYKFDKEQE